MPGYEQSWVESAEKLTGNQPNFVHLQSGNGNILSGSTNMQPGTAHIHPDPAQLPSNHIQMVSKPSMPYQNYAGPQIIFEENSKPRLRLYTGLLSLAIIQLVLAILSVAFGLAGFIVGLYSSLNPYGYVFDVDFSGIGVGALYIVACSCGIGSLRNPSGYRCLLVSYFVLLVISIVLTPAIIGWSSFWIYIAADNPWYDECTSNCVYNLKPDLALNIMLLIVAGAEMILSIVSGAFLCLNWHCGQCCRACCGCKRGLNVEP